MIELNKGKNLTKLKKLKIFINSDCCCHSLCGKIEEKG